MRDGREDGSIKDEKKNLEMKERDISLEQDKYFGTKLLTRIITTNISSRP